MKKILLFTIVILLSSTLLYVRILKDRKPNTEIKSQNIVSPSPSVDSPISISILRKKSIPPTSLSIEREIENGINYKQFIASYRSEGFKIYGLLTVPIDEQPKNGFSAIIFNHGYIPPKQYVTTEGYLAYVDYLARNGFVVFKIDYRGNGLSEGDATGTYFSSAYTIDVLSAIKALQSYEKVDPNKIGLWGHSMAGNLVLRTMLVTSQIKAGVIWAGAVYSYEDFKKYGISDTSYVHRPSEPRSQNTDLNRETSNEIQKIRSKSESINFSDPFWKAISLTQNIDHLSEPIQIHHSIDDEVVNVGYARDLVDVLKKIRGSIPTLNTKEEGTILVHPILNPLWSGQQISSRLILNNTVIKMNQGYR